MVYGDGGLGGGTSKIKNCYALYCVKGQKFLPDPGVSGVRSMGPGVHTSVQELCETLLM